MSNNTSSDNSTGISIQIDYAGKIVFFKSAGIDFWKSDFTGCLISEIFVFECFSNLLEFIISIKKDGADFGREMSVKTKDKPLKLFFAGARFDQILTIFGSRSHIDFEFFMNEMMQINNHQTNMLRNVIKSNNNDNISEHSLSEYYFEELSKLNNELVSLQRELTKKNTELIELNRLKNQFLGIASHDIRNPLSIILSYCEILLEDSKVSDEEKKEFITSIQYKAEFILNLVNELLDVTAIESGSINLNLEWVDLIKLVSDSIKFNNFLAAKKNIRIILKDGAKAGLLYLDKSKIQQVFNNLLSNAIKFSPEGKLVTVSIEESEQGYLISVEDNGLGIKELELKDLFEPFKVTSTKGTAGEKSTGLGLAIVKKAVEAHNGSISVKSIYGEGTIFTVFLPK